MSVTSPEQILRTMQKEVGRTETALHQARTREKKAIEHLREVRARARNSRSAVTQDSVLDARERSQGATARRVEAAAVHREGIKLVQEQEHLRKVLERKDCARRKAVTAFIKKWDRDYDNATAAKRKNVALRKKLVRK